MDNRVSFNSPISSSVAPVWVCRLFKAFLQSSAEFTATVAIPTAAVPTAVNAPTTTPAAVFNPLPNLSANPSAA